MPIGLSMQHLLPLAIPVGTPLIAKRFEVSTSRGHAGRLIRSVYRHLAVVGLLFQNPREMWLLMTSHTIAAVNGRFLTVTECLSGPFVAREVRKHSLTIFVMLTCAVALNEPQC